MVVIRGHNICFHGEIMNIIAELFSVIYLPTAGITAELQIRGVIEDYSKIIFHMP